VSYGEGCACALDTPASRNMGTDGVVDPRTIHEGRVVTAGRKIACNLWVLEEAFEVYRTVATP
jgi:hypothetical protein